MEQEITPEKLKQIWENKRVRQRLAFESPFWFSMLYLRHHFKHPFAPFHMEMFHLIQQTETNFIVVMAFRESGKSTIMNMGNVLWSVLGKPQKKFIVVMSQTQEQAKNHFNNLKEELKYNELLREDFGPFIDDENEWKKMSLELVYHESKIMSVSREQSIRGIKYNSLRPDLIICDDLEDISARNDKGKRDELYSRFVSEILPLGSDDTRIVVLGNLICNDSLLLRLKKNIDEGKQNGIFRIYPIIDCERRILWPGKFPDIEKVKELWRKFPRGVWIREFLLKMIFRNDDDKGPNVIFVECPDGELIKSEMPEEKEVFPRQQAIILQMEEFNISPPIDEMLFTIFSTKSDEKYKHIYGNVNLDEPMMGLWEERQKIKWVGKKYEEKAKENLALRKNMTKEESLTLEEKLGKEYDEMKKIPEESQDKLPKLIPLRPDR